MAILLVILKGISDFADGVKKIVDGVKAVQDFLADPSGEKRAKVLDAYAEITLLRQQVEKFAASILDTLSTLQFQTDLGEVLTSTGTATASYSRWKRTNDESFKVPATTYSDQGAAQLQLLIRNYPQSRFALIPVVMQFLSLRLAILRDADPGFANDSNIANWVRQMIFELRQTADVLESEVRAANIVRGPAIANVIYSDIDRDGKKDSRSTSATLSFSNASKSVSQTLTVTEQAFREPRRPAWILDTEPLQILIENARSSLEALITAGVQDDLNSVLVPQIRATADFAERALNESELLRIEPFVGIKFDNTERALYSVQRKTQSPAQALDILFSSWPDDRKKVDYEMLTDELNRDTRDGADRVASSDSLLRTLSIGSALALILGSR